MTRHTSAAPPATAPGRRLVAALLGAALAVGTAAPALAEGPPPAWALTQVSGLGGDDFGAFPEPPQISADGTRVLYEATLDGSSYRSSVLLRDRAAGTTVLVDHAPDGSPAVGYPMATDLSADGGTVVFTSGNGDAYGPAGPGTTNWGHRVYLTDAVGGPVRELPLPQGTTGQLRGVAVSDDGDTVAVLVKPDWSEEDPDGFVRVLLLDTATGEVRHTTVTSSPWAERFAVSADGDRAVVVGNVEDGVLLQVLDLTTGEQVAGFDDWGSEGPVLDADGSTVAYRSADDELVVRDLAAGTRTVVPAVEGRLPAHLSLSGDGATVAWSTGSIGEGGRSAEEDWYPRVYVAPAQGGEPVLVAGGGEVGTPGGREAGVPALSADGRTAALVVDGTVQVAVSAGDADTTAPVWPSGAATTATTTDAGDVRLSWPGALDDALAGYDVTVDGEPLASVGPTTTELVRSIPAGDHVLAVVPRDTAGNRGLPLTVTTAAVGALVLTAGEPGTVQLTLPAAGDDVAGLRVLRTTAGDTAERPTPSSAGMQVVAELPADATSWTDTGLAPLTWFGYRVDGVLADGSARPLTAVAVEHTVLPAPGATTVGAVTSSSAQVSWPAAPADLPVTGYRLERLDGRGQDARWAAVATTTSTGLAETGLAQGRTYAWRVVAELGRGWGEVPWATETSVRLQLQGVRDLAVTGQRIGDGQAFVLGSQIVVSASGETGMTGSVRLTAATDGSGTAVELPLTEVEPGRYATAPYTLDGRELDGIGLAVVTLANDSRTDTDRIRHVGVVGGRIAVTVAPGVDLTGAVLRALGTVPGVSVPLGVPGTVALDVAPGDLALDLLLPDGDVVAAQRVEVPAAGTPAVTLTPVRHSELHVVLSAVGGTVQPGSVTVTGADGELLASRSHPGGATEVVVPGLVAGTDVVVTSRLADQTRRTTQPTAAVTLAGGRTDAALRQEPLPTADLAVTATGLGAPLAEGTVTVTQVVDGRTFTSTAAVAAGSATVGALAGPATARVEAPFHVASGQTLELPGSLVVDLVREPTYRIRPHLLTTNIGSPAVEQPMDWITGAHFRLLLSGGDSPLTPAAEVPFHGRSGDVVRLCADGAEAGLSAGCVELTLGEDRDVDLTLSLEQKGAATARVLGTDGRPVTWWQADVVRTGVFGNEMFRRSVGRQYGAGPDARLSLPESGGYEVVWTSQGGGSARSTFEVGDRGTAQLGTVTLVEDPWSADQPTVTPSIVLPGQGAVIRVVVPARTSATTVAWVNLDDGITHVPGTALVDGTPIASTVVDGRVEIPLTASTATVVRIPVQVAADAEDGQRRAQVSVLSGPANGGYVPTAYYEVQAARITGPSTVTTAVVPVSGAAPAGSPVVVRDAGGRTVGTATAGPGGRWAAQVQLYNPAPRREQRLVATVGDGATASLSAPYVVTYDPQFVQPDLITLTPTDSLGQQTRRETSFDPRQGVASMTMIYVPFERVRVSARFADTSRVHGFTAYVGALSATGSCTATTCVAWLPAGSADQTGDIWIDYDVDAVQTGSWADVPVTDQDARRNALPLDWRNPQLVTAGLEGGTRVTTFTLPDGVEVTARVTVSTGPAPAATPLDAQVQRSTGLPMTGLQTSVTQRGDVLDLRVRGGLPVEWLTADPTARTALLPPVPGAVIAFTELLFSIKGWGSALTDIDGWSAGTDESRALDELRKYVLERVAPCAPAQAQQMLDDIMEARFDIGYLKGSNLAMGALGLMQGAFAEAFAAAGVVLKPAAQLAVESIVGDGFELGINQLIANRMDEVTSHVKDAPLCDPRLDTLPLFWVPPSARPHWIYDPSGTVYEALASQPLAGVTATVYSGASAEGPWTVWDAAAYGQTNPQPTTATGYYGWDVPQGWWRVEYSAPGYRTQTSAPMQVLPEHYGVDADLHRLAAPALSSASFTAAGALAVEFDEWMSVDSVRAGLSLRLGTAAVAGTLTATGAQRAPDGVLLARSFVFTPTTPLPSQAQVRLVVAGATVDHGDVALGADAARDLRAPARPDAPVACGQVGLTVAPTSRVAPGAVVTTTVTAPAGAPVQLRGITTYSVVEWLRALLTGQGSGVRPSAVLAEGRADAAGRVVLTFRASRDVLVFAQQTRCPGTSRLVVVDVR